MLAWPLHKRFFFEARLLWALAAHVLALFLVLAQPVASLAWLGGTHATLEQAVIHEAALEHGHYHHHGAPGHHQHQPEDRDGKTGTRLSQGTVGPEFTPAAPLAAPFQDLLKAALTVVTKAPVPDGPLRHAAQAGVVPSQHSPPVPHRPPILLLPTFAFLQE